VDRIKSIRTALLAAIDPAAAEAATADAAAAE
jgi:hypothetical protein